MQATSERHGPRVGMRNGLENGLQTRTSVRQCQFLLALLCSALLNGLCSYIYMYLSFKNSGDVLAILYTFMCIAILSWTIKMFLYI